MKKILICLPSEYYNKYIQLNAFKDIIKNYEVSFLFNKNKWKTQHSKLKNKYFYSLDDKEHAYFIKILHLFLVVNKNLSKTFRYHFRRWYPNFQDFIKIEKTKQKDSFGKLTNLFFLKNLVKYLYKPFLKRLIIIFFSKRIIFNLYENLILSKLNLNSDISRIVNKLKPDLIIYTTHCYEPETFMIPKIASSVKAKTFFLVDNWDNISCKTVFINKPDFLGVWGKQTKNHASKIQNIKKKDIFYTGSPKFDNYLLIRKKKLGNIFDHNYVLFFGVIELYNDIEVLKYLDEEINQNQSLYKNLKIIYRPHPARPNLFSHAKKISSLKNVILDPYMEKYLKSKNKKYLESINLYFEKLLSNSLFNVGGIGTVTIESLMFKKKQILLCHNEKNNITDPKSLFENQLHFEKIDHVTALIKAKSIDSVVKNFRKLYVNKSYLKVNKKLDKEINYFYNISKNSYSKKIFSIVKNLL